jgi:rhodanese-related sulfurtransferase
MTLSSTAARLRRGALAVLALAALQPGAPALGADNSMPEALKNIPRATGVCHRDDGPTGTTYGAGATVADLGCAAGTAALQRPGVLPADVRQGAEYASYHIDGALNVSVGDLRSKPYWRNKPVVLIGSGKAERELYMECTRLKQRGYKDVSVLRGGMAAWIAAAQPLAGRTPSLAEASRLSPEEFWQEGQDPDNLVLLAKGQAELQGDVPFSAVLPAIGAAEVRAVVERRRKETKNAPLASVILASDGSVTSAQIEALQRALLPIPVLVYAEGRAALTRQMGVQKAVWLAQAQGPKQPACGK